jgi:hypothetical protein
MKMAYHGSLLSWLLVSGRLLIAGWLLVCVLFILLSGLLGSVLATGWLFVSEELS